MKNYYVYMAFVFVWFVSDAVSFIAGNRYDTFCAYVGTNLNLILAKLERLTVEKKS